jgi:amino acid transporter
MSQEIAGARARAGTELSSPAGQAHRSGDGPRAPGSRAVAHQRPIGFWAFAGVAVASFGGPLALSALIAPSMVADAANSAGLAMLAALAVFTVPILIWLRYSRHVSGAGGLYSFVEAAAGRRVALLQAGIWTFSYALYIVYTSVQIVYDLLPAILPGERSYQTVLALAVPAAITGVMLAGRAATLIVLGLVAAGQLALAGVLDGVTLAHIPIPASTFGPGAGANEFAKASAQTSLLYICGSLPLFLGGEISRPALTIRRGLIGAYALTGLVVVLAVAPLAADPGLARTAVPGVSVAQQFSGRTLGYAIGIGIAVSTAGVILCEYLAVTRLLSAVTSWRIRPITAAVGAVVLLAAPISLIDPDGFYDTLLKPSLVALWLSQLIVFAVYPLFARKHRQRALPAWTLSVIASALALYGLWTTLHQAAS